VIASSEKLSEGPNAPALAIPKSGAGSLSVDEIKKADEIEKTRPQPEGTFERVKSVTSRVCDLQQSHSQSS
jgi:hypothetical protein